MNLNELLVDLSNRGVKMWADQGQLRLRAPKGVLTPELQRMLAERKIEILQMIGGEVDTVPLVAVDRDPPPTLSFMQERLWFLSQMYPQGVAYNLPNAHRLRGALDPDALTAALQTLVSRHEALRTTFAMLDGMTVQRVSPDAGMDFRIVDLSDQSDPHDAAEQIALREANHVFDLESGPLLRMRLLRFAADDHLFVWTLHHIISDGWSSLVFLRELKALYEEHTGGPEAALAPLPVQYADFAVWERGWLQGEVLESQLAYWRQRFDGFQTVLDLPTDHLRPAVIEYRGSYQSISLSHALTEQLRKLSRDSGATLFVSLLAVFKVLLQRYSGVQDICVGSPIARRNRPEIEHVVGCFINTLPLRTDLSGDPSFGQLLARVRETCTGAFGHQDVPFEQLVEALHPQRDTSRTPLFQVMFILHVQDTRKVTRIGNVELAPVEYHTDGSKLDLTLELKETSDGLEGFIEYSTDLFEAATIARMAQHFRNLVTSAVAQPQAPLSALDILSATERQQLLDGWNDTAADYPADQAVHQLVAAQALRTPDAIAVADSTDTLRYQALEQRANQLARHLQTLGVGAGQLVGICLTRSPQMLVGLLGILKTGAAYLPLDPSFPRDRLAFMLQDAGSELLLTETELQPVLPEHRGKRLYLDTAQPAVDEQDPAPLEIPAGPGQLAYVIYTSGSTGKPKGVQIPHRALTNFLCSMAKAPGISADDTLLAVTTLSFDIAALELFLPLLAGGKVVIAGRDEAADAARLTGLIDACAATVMQATPATWRLLLESGWQGRPGLKVLCGGEALSRELAEQLLAADMELWNMYGPTETTIWSALEKVSGGTGAVPIGRPIDNTRLHVLDDRLALLPTGAIGELYIGGDGLAQGYLNRPELTAERFIPNPFADGERLYRTGDMARYLADGTLEVLGRSDHQVKVRGYRIELGEIEAVLRAHPAVQEAVVIVREDVVDDKRIVAYLIGVDQEATLEQKALRTHLQQSLPEYMVPSAYVTLAQYPMTANAKIDRKVLQMPETDQGALANDYLAPRNDTERALAEIWADVLGLPQVGVHDDFFALGGHSLLAVRLVARIDATLGKKIPLVAVFQERTIENIAGTIDDPRQQQANSVCAAIREGGDMPPFFAGGSDPRYVDVAQALGPDQPFYRLDVYALQEQRLATGDPPFRRIEDIAARMIEDIRTIQPTGPYYLGGGCEGGIVAYEIARQLQQQGEKIACVLIWVVQAPHAWKSPSLRYSALRLMRQLHQLLSKDSVLNLRFRDLSLLFKHELIEYRIFQAINQYRPTELFKGELTLARHYLAGFPELEEETMGWKDLATGGTEVHELPGNHGDWLDTHAGAFSELLQECLEKARLDVEKAPN